MNANEALELSKIHGNLAKKFQEISKLLKQIEALASEKPVRKAKASKRKPKAARNKGLQDEAVETLRSIKENSEKVSQILDKIQ